LRPAQGVYAVRVADISDDTEDAPAQWRDGVANFGNRPTFDGTDALLEVHLFDFDGDLYGRTLRVRFIDFLRPECKFAGIEDLKRQITDDAGVARQILKDMRPEFASAEVVQLNRQRALR
jgi:riboflavin kinase / FMN adenylyltransferase